MNNSIQDLDNAFAIFKVLGRRIDSQARVTPMSKVVAGINQRCLGPGYLKTQ